VGLAIDLDRRGSLTPDRREILLGRASRTLQRVSQLVDGLLILARSGTKPPTDASSDVGLVVGDVVEELAPLAREKEIELRVERLDPCVAACSPGVLTSILSNLVGNALKFMGDSPVRHVGIRVLELGPRVRMEVADTGPGVPDGYRQRIFEPYFRATPSSAPGLGLGLATVRRMVEAHGGRVGLEAPGVGSLFWFELPLGGAEPRVELRPGNGHETPHPDARH
jgi:signal transduction histidine kinase